MSILDQLGKVVGGSGAQAESRPDRPSGLGGAAGSGTREASGQDRPAHLDALEKSKAEAAQKISGLFAELGKSYYESHADDQHTEYETQMAAIREAFAEIDRCQREADEIAARKRCPACGAQLPEGSMFCNMCGAKLSQAPDAAEQPEPEQRLCPKCGTALGPDDLFCVSCGADLRK